MGLNLLGLLGGEATLVLGQTTADGPGLPRPQVKGNVLLALVQLAEVLTGLLVDDGQHAGDGLANDRAVGVGEWPESVTAFRTGGNPQTSRFPCCPAMLSGRGHDDVGS